MREASSPTSHPMNQSAANSFANSQIMSNNGRSVVQIDIFNSNIYSDPLSHGFDTQSLRITTSLNPHENGLRRSIRLRELQKRKSHTTYGTTAATKVAFGVFSFFSLASSFKMPKHRTNPNSTYTEQVMNWFHEVN